MIRRQYLVTGKLDWYLLPAVLAQLFGVLVQANTLEPVGDRAAHRRRIVPATVGALTARQVWWTSRRLHFARPRTFPALVASDRTKGNELVFDNGETNIHFNRVQQHYRATTYNIALHK